MNKNSKNKSISENIANLLNSAPDVFNEDEDEIDQTSAKVLTDYQSDDDFDETIIGRSKIRAQNADLLDNLDKKYAGKVGSRKELRESSDESEEESLNDTDDDTPQSEDETMKDAENRNESDQDESVDVGESGSDESESGSGEGESNFKHFHDSDVNEQSNKGIFVRNQLNIWENLLETRIELQKCLFASNKMPTGEYFKELQKVEDKEYKEKLLETKKSVSNVLDKMVTLQTLFVEKYPETKNVFSEKQRKEGSEEEITSEEELSEPEEEQEVHPKKKRKIQDYEEIIAKRHKLYKNYRNNTIQKWNEKCRIGALSKNNLNPHTILNQIELILSDKSRLIKKTQLKKSEYKVLGEVQNEEDEESAIYNENIYDDVDFYEQLLHELIEFRSSGVTDPVQLGKQWVQLQSMRSKMKRKIDTRATKGRKIRYAVHSKLVNFMAPFDHRSTWTDEAKKELFGSLFGKKPM